MSVMKMMALALMMVMAAGTMAFAGEAAAPAVPQMQDYAKDGQLEPLPDGMASLYRTPWRSNVRTASAYDFLNGVGVYYKHVPAWSIEQNTHVMKEMASCGVKRVRLAPHYAMSISPEWKGPSEGEIRTLVSEMTACKNAGIRPCVVFVHLPPFPSQESLQKYMEEQKPWKKDWMPQGPIGSPQYNAYLEKTWEALEFLLKTGRECGFTKADSYDVELGQNLWWGFPAMKPNPSLTLKDLQPGGSIYEFDRALAERARVAGYAEANLLWSQSHHYFEHMTDTDIPDPVAGRSISVYSQFQGITDDKFVGGDDWPARPALKFYEGTPPAVMLFKPEGFMADFSRRDCMIPLLKAGTKPVALTSLGVVPYDIPGLMVEKDVNGRKTKVKADNVDGWELKCKGLTRSLAFWLNQGVSFVLIHSAYEHQNDEMSHALIPWIKTPADVQKEPKTLPDFNWERSRPLSTMHDFVAPLKGASRMSRFTDLKFKYALAKDAELIAKSDKAGPLMASDAVALLAFQLGRKKFAVAAYIVTPTLTVPYAPTRMTVQVDKVINGDVTYCRPVTRAMGMAPTLDRAKDSTTFSFEVADDVTWLSFEID